MLSFDFSHLMRNRKRKEEETKQASKPITFFTWRRWFLCLLNRIRFTEETSFRKWIKWKMKISVILFKNGQIFFVVSLLEMMHPNNVWQTLDNESTSKESVHMNAFGRHRQLAIYISIFTSRDRVKEKWKKKLKNDFFHCENEHKSVVDYLHFWFEFDGRRSTITARKERWKKKILLNGKRNCLFIKSKKSFSSFLF